MLMRLTRNIFSRTLAILFMLKFVKDSFINDVTDILRFNSSLSFVTLTTFTDETEKSLKYKAK